MTERQQSYVSNKARAAELEQRKAKIRELNDMLRSTLTGGFVTVTPGIRALGVSSLAAIVNAIQSFDEFGEENDPHGEHDFGAITCGEHKIFWKIDYYDKQLEYGSPDPAHPAVTARVLTIMLASEY